MRAVLVREFAPFDTIEVAETAGLEPQAGEVVVEVAVAEMNYPDLLVVEGKYQFKPPRPFSPGKAAAGRVAKLGAGVDGLRVGQPVALQVEYGTYAEQVRVRAESCFPMPDGMDFETAAALGLAYQTALLALQERAAFRPGETVLVLGAAGGIGVAGVQLARALGARFVVAGARGESNAAVARAAGAHHVIELGQDGLRDRLRAELRALTGGRGADVVIDPVGGVAFEAALRALEWCGRLVVVGFASGAIPEVKANYLLVKNIAVIGFQWSDYRDRTPALVAAAQDQLFRLYEAGSIKPLVSRVLPLEGFREGLAALRDGKVQGKILLRVARP